MAWQITIINETAEGYLLMSPDGETQWMTREEYQKVQANEKN
jgi:hypothetical protein